MTNRKTIRHNPLPGIIIGCVLAASLFSCAGFASATGIAAQIAGGLGIIDSKTALAIARSADAISKAAEEITPEQEYYIGRAVGANILETYRPYKANPALTKYVNSVCQAIVINSPRPDIFNGYNVMILDSNEINAFATSGGHIFITRGLLRCAASEDALAAVVAHEIAHIQLQHSIKAIKASRITQALLVTGGSAIDVATQGMSVGELTDVFSESVSDIVTTLVNNGYSQNQEFNADNVALALMADAGYDPSSLLEMLNVLKQRQQGNAGGFSKTHPSADSRIEKIRQPLKDYTAPDTRQYREPRFGAQNLQ